MNNDWSVANLFGEFTKEMWEQMFADEIKLEILMPVPREYEIARYNRDHPDQCTTIHYMSLEEAKQKYPYAKIVTMPDKINTGVDPYAKEPFEQFWLETDKFYEMVDKTTNRDALFEIHPNPQEYLYARRKVLIGDEFEAFASFGTGPEYTGMTLSQWLAQRDMLCFFNKRTATKLPLGFDNIPGDILHLKSFKTFEITGRGTVLGISLSENGYDHPEQKVLHDWFMNKLVTHEHGWYIVKGIEAAVGSMGHVNDKVGLLIRQWGVWHQLPPDIKIVPYDKDKFKLP